ncbi:MAG: LacI family DNA-binding transcriptional regulator [Clostridia bacterium]|nr:LacI family DNA-binding transcriptional regulator [Clostridia bacterium]
MTKKPITIYDIAREAQVSPATVSRVLTGTAAVRKDKAERVRQLIQKYHFQPNGLAKALSENKSHLIAVVVAHTNNSYYNSLLSACETEAYSRGYVTMLMNTYSNPDNEWSIMQRMRELRPDAAIVCGGRIDLETPDPEYQGMLCRAMEYTRVIVGSRSPMPGIPGISVDHRGSIRLGLRYLNRLGHREIGYIYTGTPYYGTKQRLTTFREVMAEMGLPLREEWLIHVPGYDITSGRQGVEQLMSLSRRPTALLGMNDMVSVGILQGLLANGLRVPQDISLLGFDDTFVTDITTPRLTSVGYDYQLFARQLLDAALYEGPVEELSENQLIPVYLTERDSVCRAGAG